MLATSFTGWLWLPSLALPQRSYVSGWAGLLAGGLAGWAGLAAGWLQRASEVHFSELATASQAGQKKLPSGTAVSPAHVK